MQQKVVAGIFAKNSKLMQPIVDPSTIWDTNAAGGILALRKIAFQAPAEFWNSHGPGMKSKGPNFPQPRQYPNTEQTPISAR